VLLGAAGREDHRGLGGRQPFGGPVEVGDRYAGDPLDPVGPVRRDTGAHRRVPLRALLDVRLVDPALADRDVEHAVRKGEVGSGHRLQVQRRTGGGRGTPRVDDDVSRTSGPARVEELHGRRHRRGGVRADQQDGVGVGEVRERERQPAVDAERPVPGSGGGRHAEPSVVVDHAGAQRNSRELAERIRLLVGQAAAAEATDAVGSVALLGLLDAGDDGAEGLVPRGRPERAGAVAGDAAEQRREQALRVVEEIRGVPALGAQAAEVGREVRLRLEGDGPVAGGHADAALQRAVRDSASASGAGLRSTPHDDAAGVAFRGPARAVNSSSRCAHIVFATW
jgi:hypothetical protein